MAEKTIALTGAEEKIEYGGGCNAWLRNDGTATVYAAKSAGVTAGADGVVAVPAGGSAPLYGADGTVFLLGTGSVQLIGSDYSTNPFKTSTASGGSGVDDVARAAIEAHSGNADIHVTAAEKAAWNGKAELSDIPTSLPANGGNADTVGGSGISSGGTAGVLTVVGDYGVTALGPYIDFHTEAGQAYDGRLVRGSGMFWLFNADNSRAVLVADIQGNAETLGNRQAGDYALAASIPTKLSELANDSGFITSPDGGNAASVGSYTEEKIAALEARIAALEGGGT